MAAQQNRTAAHHCGDPPMKAARLFARDRQGGVPALFVGRDVHWSFNTRVAIRAACDLLNLRPGDEILAPAYYCGSELDPLIHAGLTVTLYPVKRNCVADPEEIVARISPRTRAIYITHYFGFLQPHLHDIRALCDARGLRLIEDCALSLLSGAQPAEGHTGDVSVFCFYKFFPVLGGGAMVINATDLDRGNPFRRAPPLPRVAHEMARSMLKGVLGAERLRSVKSLFRGSFQQAAPNIPPEGELSDIPQHYYFDPAQRDTRISMFAKRPMRAFDIAATIAARRENYQLLQDLLVEVPGAAPLFAALPPNVCPLTMPLLVADRDRIAARLQAQGIAATPWWAGYNRRLDPIGQTDAAYLKSHVLSLPLHQFMGAEDVEYMVTALREVMRTG